MGFRTGVFGEPAVATEGLTDLQKASGSPETPGFIPFLPSSNDPIVASVVELGIGHKDRLIRFVETAMVHKEPSLRSKRARWDLNPRLPALFGRVSWTR